MRPNNVGIIGLEIYFPKIYVSQEEMEVYDQAGKGKYTIGLAQKEMSFLEDFEDVNSIALTVVKSLLEKYQIDPKQIGRLEVGSETLIDKSKSLKTVLMDLFKESGNFDVEGVTSLNACYGGTAALLNTAAWIESSAWDGRFGLVVTADVAEYSKGPARPTSGAGAIAILIGPNAPIVINPIRASYFTNSYDFYKPNPFCSYPVVDGQLSIQCYLEAVEQCYNSFKAKLNKSVEGNTNSNQSFINSIPFFCFHAPYGKLVQKGFFKLMHLEILQKLIKVDDQVYETLSKQGYESKQIQTYLSTFGNNLFQEKVKPSLFISEKIGNTYTGSLYSSLISLIYQKAQELKNQNILMFSYGSGIASTMFQLHVVGDVSYIQQMLDLDKRFESRVKISIDQFQKIMDDKEQLFGKMKDMNLQPNFEHLEPGTYYLKSIDNKWQRFYEKVPKVQQQVTLSLQEIQNRVIQSMMKQEMITDQKKSKESNSNANSNYPASVEFENKLEQVSDPNLKLLKETKHMWSGFYQKAIMERVKQIEKIYPDLQSELYLQDGGLKIEQADLMIENCIGKLAIPLGLGLNFVVNGIQYIVPMAIEEPSVIAGASSAAKFVQENSVDNGFIASSQKPIMVGQIQILSDNYNKIREQVLANKKLLIDFGNEICPNMIKRQSGVFDIQVRLLQKKILQQQSQQQGNQQTSSNKLESMIVLDVFIDVNEAMGANIVNTIVEHMGSKVADITGERVGIKILTNLCIHRMAQAKFAVPIKKMGWKDANGEQVAQKVIEAYNFAQMDYFRAVTHNKGIMNGIDAVALATGQDWRSIEASCHSYAFYGFNKDYQPLTKYELKEDSEGNMLFCGQIDIPIAVGTIGGSLKSNKIYESNLKLMNYPSNRELAQIMACVGLAQNFAALRALAIQGIQAGHMKLHARNIAVSVGIPTYLVEDAVRFMSSIKNISVGTAKQYLDSYYVFTNIREQKKSNLPLKQKNIMSTLYIELQTQQMAESLKFHVAFDCQTSEPIHIVIGGQNGKSTGNPQIIQSLFGEKSYEWLYQMMTNLDDVSIKFKGTLDGGNLSDISRSNEGMTNIGANTTFVASVVQKLKLISILVVLITYNMMKYDLELTEANMLMIEKGDETQIINQIQNQAIEIKYGVNLIIELIHIFEYNIQQKVLNSMLKKALKQELFNIIFSQIKTKQMWDNGKSKLYTLDQFIQVRKKRLCATQMFLIDAVNQLPSILTEDIISIIKEVGNIYEQEVTCIRDLTRYMEKKDLQFPNSYIYYLILNNKVEQGLKNETIKQYYNLVYEKLDQERSLINPKLQGNIKQMCEVANSIIKQYYKFDITKYQ